MNQCGLFWNMDCSSRSGRCLVLGYPRDGPDGPGSVELWGGGMYKCLDVKRKCVQKVGGEKNGYCLASCEEGTRGKDVKVYEWNKLFRLFPQKMWGLVNFNQSC